MQRILTVFEGDRRGTGMTELSSYGVFETLRADCKWDVIVFEFGRHTFHWLDDVTLDRVSFLGSLAAAIDEVVALLSRGLVERIHLPLSLPDDEIDPIPRAMGDGISIRSTLAEYPDVPRYYP